MLDLLTFFAERGFGGTHLEELLRAGAILLTPIAEDESVSPNGSIDGSGNDFLSNVQTSAMCDVNPFLCVRVTAPSHWLLALQLAARRRANADATATASMATASTASMAAWTESQHADMTTGRASQSPAVNAGDFNFNFNVNDDQNVTHTAAADPMKVMTTRCVNY